MRAELGRLRAAVRANPYGAAAVVLAVAAGALVFGLGHELFPYLSRNHDEGVYLQQAAMLLDGRLFLRPGSPALTEAFRPWFFVESARGLYPKYAPVPAAMFAAGELLGGYRLALAAIAAANVGLGYLLGAAAFDRRTGLLAAAAFAASPLFLVNSATFLPYAPTTALNLLFAVAYVRSARRDDHRYAALAGAAAGLAFFARPYTAVLFALPFMAHAAWRVARALPDDRPVLGRTALTAGVGLAFVGATLGYNAVTTGSALVFPYQAFAPLDGVGFGRRALLGYGRVYSVDLALRVNTQVLTVLLTDWLVAGPLGAAAAGLGIALSARGLARHGVAPKAPLSTRRLQVLLLGVIVTVAAGNVAFWGNLNILGRLGDPSDGFISVLGPFYHFDLLLPLAAFAAHGALSVADGVRSRLAGRLSPRGYRVAVAVLLVVSLAAVGAAESAALEDPIDRNREQTERLQQAYAPFETAALDGALVLLPPTYGEWRNHPFQWLRNDPGFDGPTVYALSLGSASDFAVLDAYPERPAYRYRYHGVWSPDRRVWPRLERIEVVDTPRLDAETTVAVPDRVVDLRASLGAGDRVRRYAYRGELPERLTIGWTVGPEGASLEHPNLTSTGGAEPNALAIEGPTELVVTITITEPGGGTLTYRQELRVRPAGAGVQAVWPPSRSVCTLVTDCGLEGTYLPDRPETRPSGIEMNTTLREADGA